MNQKTCSQTEWATIAGFFMGDGCIHSQGNPPYVTITFGQKGPKILQWLQLRIGGRLVQHKQGHWILSLGRKELVMDCCQGMWPYLVVKKDQVRVGYALASLVGTLRRDKRYELHKRLRGLKNA